MRKIVLAFCSLLLILIMAGCAGNNKSDNGEKYSKAFVPSDEMTQVYSNLLFVAMSTHDWKAEPDYKYTKEDIKPLFDEISEENMPYQLYISKAIADSENKSVYVGENGAKYHYIASAEEYSEYLHNMYGIREDFYKDLNCYDLAKSSIVYDEKTDAVYYHDGFVILKSCNYKGYESTDFYTTSFVYSVSSRIDDDTNLDGDFKIRISENDGEGWCTVLEDVTFDRNSK